MLSSLSSSASWYHVYPDYHAPLCPTLSASPSSTCYVLPIIILVTVESSLLISSSNHHAPSLLLSLLSQIVIKIIFQVARRCWTGNEKAEHAICRAMEDNPKLKITKPNQVKDPSLLKRAFKPWHLLVI